MGQTDTIFRLTSNYQPSGDQGYAIEKLTKYIQKGYDWQTLWGVTGSGKTFTMANVIQNIGKPTLIIAHNKTLAAQLAQEFKEFFPDAAVHYFVSYYDYYQPEAYVQKTDTYIEKEATINEEIDRLRHAATEDLLHRKDVIIVASVSCIYGIGDIASYTDQILHIQKEETYIFEDLIQQLILMQFTRAGSDFTPGNFLVQGDIIEIWPASKEFVYTLEFWGNELTQISSRHPISGEVYNYHDSIDIFPAKHTVTSKDTIQKMIPEIQKDLKTRLAFFEKNGEVVKHERLKTKVEYDIEMMQEVGYVNGIENYSRYLDRRKPGHPPQTLIDYFGDDFLTIIDESHMTIPQIGGMYAGDRSRKENLVGNGFRLPSALDNRPLKFDEFEKKLSQVIAVSATPGTYEIGKSGVFPVSANQDTKNTDDETQQTAREQASIATFLHFSPTQGNAWTDTPSLRVVPQMIRPTGLLDPEIIIKPMEFMVDDIMQDITEVIDVGERMLITTLTKRSSEELSEYLLENGVKVQYLHSEIDTLERLEILKDLREGKIDVIVGVNLLREGLDLPEVSKIAILDADKQGFLRSEQALVQIIGRAARNQRGTVTMYVEKIKSISSPVSKGKGIQGTEELGETQTSSSHSEPVSESQSPTKPSLLPHSQPLSSRRRESEGVSSLLVGENVESFVGGGLGESQEIEDIYLGKLSVLDKGKFVTSEGLVISQAMKKAIDVTYYRRNIQQQHNITHNITPTTIYSSIKDIGISSKKKKSTFSQDPKILEQEITRLELEMDIAAANMEYEQAAELRDELFALKKGKKRKK